VKLFNFLLDVTYLSVLIIYTGAALSPFVPFYLPIVVLSAYLLFSIDSFIVSGYSAVSFGITSIFLTEKIPENLFLISVPSFPPIDIVLIEFIVYSFVFIFTAAVSSLVVQVLREQLIRVKVDISDIVEAIDYGIITVDGQGRIVWSNSRAEDFLHIALSPGKILSDIVSFPFKEPIQKLLSRKEKKVEFENEDRILMMRSSDLLDGKGTILMINDQTEEKEIEKKMQMRDKLVTLGNFAANLAHEVRNPVSSIRASAELIGPSVKRNVDKNEKLRKLIIKESDRLDYLVESFLDFTKSFNLENRKISPYNLVEDIISDLKTNKFFNEAIKFKNEVSEDFTMKGDYNLLKSVLSNLGVNSLKAMSEGGALSFGNRKDGDKKILFVKDTGCGIKEKDLNKVFSPFYTQFKEGFGFGLPIVKKIVELHNWNIEISSVVGEGTEIRIIV
jgi:signal transduction histidine kinase